MTSKDLPVIGDIVIIGYGDAMRGDGAVGHKIAQRIVQWGLPDVRVIATPRLTPEISEELSQSHLAIFVHAIPPSRGEEVTAQALDPCPSKITSSRIEDPCVLLSITQATYGRYPYAWCIEVPGVNFDFGPNLSPEAEHGIGVALERINHLIEESCYLPV
ncbi:MAG: hydrogenase maturation protease [Acidobacteriia bacterium]|nr:hydrogenase maturation protease [Terriglobia bacterium]